MLPIHQLKQIRSRANDAFRAPQHEKCSWLQGIMKNRHQSFLQNRPEVDQHIAATDKVYARKRRILEKVLPGENAHIADRFGDSIATFHFDEKATQLFRRDISRNTFRVCSCPGFLNAWLAEVCAKKLDGNTSFSIAQELEQRNAVRVRFFAR